MSHHLFNNSCILFYAVCNVNILLCIILVNEFVLITRRSMTKIKVMVLYLERIWGKEPSGSYIAPQSVVMAVIFIFCFEIVYS